MKVTKTPTRRRKISVEEALFEIAEYGIEADSMADYYRHIHQIAKKLMYAENFYIALFDNEQNTVNFVYFEDAHDTVRLEDIQNLSPDYLKRTLTGHLMQTGQMIHVNREQILSLCEQGIIESTGKLSHDWLGVPVLFKGELLGALIIQSYLPEVSYSTRDERVLQFMARQIAMIFKSKQLEQQLRQSNLELEQRVAERTRELHDINAALAQEIEERKKSELIQNSLFRISELVASSNSLRELYAGVHQIIKAMMYAENFYIALLDDAKKRVHFPYFCDERDSQPSERPFGELSQDAGLTERVLRFGQTLLISRTKEDADTLSGDGHHAVSWLGVPLKEREDTFGIIAVQSYDPQRVHSENDKAVLETIARQVAVAILRKKDAEALREAHENLEKRVRERTSELEATIEKRKAIEKQLEHDSLHDALTQLPNRAHLIKRLRFALEQAKQGDPKLAVLFIDLDRFKLINDSLGHHIGDEFLKKVARKLLRCVRSHDLVARLGGDEFCILMEDVEDDDGVLHTAQRVLHTLSKPIAVENHSLFTSGSIGIRIVHSLDSSAEELMADADAAMYQAKHQGKNQFCLFDADIKEIVSSRMLLENALREAIDRKALSLVLQPIFALNNDKISGFEALVRWHHPEHGNISPAKFIPIAEETGLIVPLGEEVLRMACEAVSQLRQVKEFADTYVNINVSAVQILAQIFDQSLRKHLDDFQLPPNSINVEITESILIEDYKSALQFVRELKALGIKTYLDDFGTGYSSLSYLKQFPFDALKLDRSFISDIEQSETNKAIVQSIGYMAKNLGMDIVAEGVESVSQLELIKRLGYTAAQGFLLARPMQLDDLMEWLKKQG